MLDEQTKYFMISTLSALSLGSSKKEILSHIQGQGLPPHFSKIVGMMVDASRMAIAVVTGQMRYEEAVNEWVSHVKGATPENVGLYLHMALPIFEQAYFKEQWKPDGSNIISLEENCKYALTYINSTIKGKEAPFLATIIYSNKVANLNITTPMVEETLHVPLHAHDFCDVWRQLKTHSTLKQFALASEEQPEGLFHIINTTESKKNGPEMTYYVVEENKKNAAFNNILKQLGLFILSQIYSSS